MTMQDADDHRGKKPDRAYLQRAALAYLERYATSAENLRRVLLRKARRRLGPGLEPDENVLKDIDEVIEAACRMDLVDDTRFAQGRVATLMRKGASKRAMSAKLASKGVDRDTVEQALEQAGLDDLASARRFAQRRRLGPWRTSPDPDRRERDLAALGRAGFSYEVSRSVIDGMQDDGAGD
jgi:regulatory protein